MYGEIVAGIDFGSKNARSCVVVRGETKVVAAGSGARHTPLVVVFTEEDEPLVGEAALVAHDADPQLELVEVMRLLDDTYGLPWKTKDSQGSILIEVEAGENKRRHSRTWVQLMTLVLLKIKEDMEASAGSEVKKVVLSVASSVLDVHKAQLAQSSNAAGLSVLGIIDRAVAVGYGYNLQKKTSKKQSVFVFRYGSQYLEVSIISFKDGVFSVLSSEMYPIPSMDDIMTKHFLSEISRQHGLNMSTNKLAMHKLLQACRELKHSLSFSEHEELVVPSTTASADFKFSLSRTRLDELNKTLYAKIPSSVQNALESADMKAADIDEVILCGGSCRVPKVEVLVRDCFKDTPIRSDVDVALVGAMGAARYATLAALRALSESRDLTPLQLLVKEAVLARSVAPHQPAETRNTEPAIGIDLGTTNSCVAVVRNGKVEVIANDIGSRITPSYVAFTDEDCLVGAAAKAQAVNNSRNTVFDVKRLIGRKFLDVDTPENTRMWPFKVVDEGGVPKVQVLHKKTIKTLSSEELSAMILRKMKSVAETFVGSVVRNAVITVPAYFKDSQRQATLDAGKIAGLNVLAIINEPTAAALAFGVEKAAKERRHVLIFDLGGGTFDVAVVAIEDKNFEVLAVNGNNSLGGRDFDDRLVQHFIGEFKKKHGADLASDDKAKTKLRLACEKVKIDLSVSVKSRLQIVALHNGIDFISNISRVRFELLCSDLFLQTLVPVKRVLLDAGLDASAVDEVVLVGGSTRIPKIQELLQKHFQGKKLNKSIDPDHAVAYGAALQADVLARDSRDRAINLVDVCPMTIGVAEFGIFMSPLIYRNTRIPTKKTSYYSTANDFQQALTIAIYEGDNKLCIENNLLGQFKLCGIENAEQGRPNIELTCAIDKNGILKVSAKDKSTGSRQSIHITSLKGRLEKSDIDRCMAEASSYGNEDKQLRLIARASLERYCLQMKNVVEDKLCCLRSLIDQALLRDIDTALTATMAWLDDNEGLVASEFDLKRAELEKRCAGLL
ncbi:hypothetical protein HAZT_HAZT007813 [Hyalella azteca]|uniref:Uncharacterized protein n=1 Tax=Hyalella azteca TaxID=294128 RepID=A0A6A0GWX7_HYAAZ|nr:hypothetical protein HAZT_HAZT007813 [Hyalella azteca]